MVSALKAAARGMAAQSERISQVAQSVASVDATPAITTRQSPQTSVRIGALPVGGTIEQSMVTLVEAESAYRMNAVVLATADAVLTTLLDTLATDK